MNPNPFVARWIDTLLSAVSQDAPQELEVPFFRTTRLTPRCKVNSDAIALSRVLPVDIDTMYLPPVVCSLQQDGSPGDLVAVLPVESLWCAALRELQRQPPEMEQNVSLQILHCPCGEYHVQVVLVKPGVVGDILVPGSFGDPKIFVQFDGSALTIFRSAELVQACLRSLPMASSYWTGAA